MSVGTAIRTVTRSFSVVTGGGGTFFLFRAWDNCILQRVVIGPDAAWSADASNYWTLSLRQYDEDGTELVGIPFSEDQPTWATNALSLAVGRVVLLPQVGYVGHVVLKDQGVWLQIAETGTAATLKITVQVELTVMDPTRGR